MSKPSLYLLLIVLAALNLRPCLASISPIVSQIKYALGMSDEQIGLLSTIPVSLMGILSLAGGKIQKLFGTSKGVIIGLALISGGLFLRSVDASSHILLLSAFFCGVGVAIEQVLLPVYIRLKFQSSRSFVMSIYSTSIMSGAAISSALASPLTHWMGWRGSLAIWGMLGFTTFILWLVFARGAQLPGKTVQNDGQTVLNDRYSWRLMSIFGIGTAAYTLVLAWLPTFYVRHGWSEVFSGYLLAALTATEVIAGFGVSFLLSRYPDRRSLFLISTFLLILGILNMLICPNYFGSAVVLLGLSIGALFPLSLVITADYSKDAKHLASLIGFVQGGGYIIAAITPYLGGIIQDKTNNSQVIWMIMLVMCPVLMFLSIRIKRNIQT